MWWQRTSTRDWQNNYRKRKKENYVDILNCIRIRLKFCFLIAIISVRGKKCRENAAPIILSFNLTDMVIKQYSELTGIAWFFSFLIDFNGCTNISVESLRLLFEDDALPKGSMFQVWSKTLDSSNIAHKYTENLCWKCERDNETLNHVNCVNLIMFCEIV